MEAVVMVKADIAKRALPTASRT